MAWLFDLLQGIPVNPVLRERLALTEQKYTAMEEEVVRLREQNARLATEVAALTQEVEAFRRAQKAKPKMKWGCYEFEGEEGLYCPACYDTEGKKYRTTRLNPHRRRCTVCQKQFGS